MSIILAIESSCDETAASVVKDGRIVLSNVISSQIEIHKKFGGVVPEVASRKHLEAVNLVIEQAITEANITYQDIDYIAVTYAPGLVGALLVGVSAAKALSYALKKPLIPVHHIRGHICANYIEHPDLKPPFMCLVASGGHSHLIYVKDYTDYLVVGQTRDDAAGEAFDKVARVLGLGYPGGPKIDNLSKSGNPHAIQFKKVKFADNKYDFSFSGIKTAVINYYHSIEQKGETFNSADVAASFQQSVCEVMVDNLIDSAREYSCDTVVLAGGVACNTALRNELDTRKGDLKVYYPSPIYCTDNAAMIASAGRIMFEKEMFSSLDLSVKPSYDLEEESVGD